MNNRVIIHADMDAFFASVEQHDHPELRGKPVVVGAPADRRGVVAAASYEARTFGIRSAMPSREAYRRCPAAIFRPVNMRRYIEVSERIQDIFQGFTPLVEPLSLDEAFLDVTGAQRLFGDGPAIARKIRAAVKAETGLTVSAGVAGNKFLAKIASDLNKPDGLTLVPSGPAAIRQFLEPLPVDRIWGVGRVTREHLIKHGIRTIGDIQRIPLDQLARQVGHDAAITFKTLADGQDDRPVETGSEEKSLSREHTFDTDTSDRDEVAHHLIALVDDVGRRLRTLDRYATGVQIKLRWKDFKTLTRQKQLDPPCADDFSLLAAARSLLDKEPFVQPVRLIGFGVHDLTGPAPRQLSLFSLDRPPFEKTDRLSRTVDSLREQFGPESIRRGT